MIEALSAAPVNVGYRLSRMAQAMPEGAAVIVPCGRDGSGRRTYRRYSFRELDEDSSRLARGLCARGVVPGTRLALMVRPGFDFISLVFALFKAGAVVVLIDPGMGRKNVLKCLDEAQPLGFIAIPLVHALRVVFARRYRLATMNVTVGRRWFWGGPTLDELRRGTVPSGVRESSDGWLDPAVATRADDPAAIIFTSGSTGPPKGVLYTHGNFDAQVDQIRDAYGIEPHAIDLACFPLFGLFNCAMGVTTVVPDMDASRPARVDPANIVEAVRDCRITQSFASPAVWDRVGRYCEARGIELASLARVFSAGAPVPAAVLGRMKHCLAAGAELHTPYGATEALPVATIAADEVLSETCQATERGAGTCVGRRFSGIEWQVIRIADRPIPTLAEVEQLPPGEIGELIVRGRVVTRQYLKREDANAWAKIADGEVCWHRMGDVGYLDPDRRFWYCGRMSQRVTTSQGTLFTEPCECVFNVHPAVYRSALVGVGLKGRQRPVIVVEPLPEHWPRSRAARALLVDALRTLATKHATTAGIRDFLFHHSFPVDVRHNSKIFRERLAIWAAGRLR